MTVYPIGTSWFRRGATAILAFSWIAGLVSGFLLFNAVGDYTVSLMVGCIYAPVSIVTLAQTYIFPLLCSAFAVFLSSPWLLPVICFGKALLFSFVFSGISFAWGTSAAFTHWMILVCDGLTTPFLYLWWLRHIYGDGRVSLPALFLYLLPSTVISWAVFNWIIPFWADVLIL